MNVNRPHLELLNQLMKYVVDKHSDLHTDLHALHRQQQDSHDTRIIQTDEYRRHHQTPDTEIYAPISTRSSVSHLIATCDATANLAATINTPHSIVPTHVRYDNWSPSLPSSPVFRPTATPTTICRKHQRLLTVNASTIRILRQIKRQLMHTIWRQRTDTINHNINISQLRQACQAARPRMLSAPQLCIAATHPQNPGEDPLTVQAMTIPDQIQATRNTYGRQMAPPPGDPLFYGTLLVKYYGMSLCMMVLRGDT